jgi:hypothetical protein
MTERISKNAVVMAGLGDVGIVEAYGFPSDLRGHSNWIVRFGPMDSDVEVFHDLDLTVLMEG